MGAVVDAAAGATAEAGARWGYRWTQRCQVIVGTTASDQHPGVAGVVVWMAACGVGAALLITVPTWFGRTASLGLAAGLLFADGDISAKLVVYGGLWLVAIPALIALMVSGRAF